VPLTDDTELRELFVAEVSERAERLIAGARAMKQGSVGRDAAHDLYREGHTIKGTARMMGFAALSDAGRLLEDTWKAVVDGEVRPSAELGAALEGLSERLVEAIDGDPELGPAELADEVRTVRRVLRGDDPQLPTGEMPAGVAGMEVNAGESHDLGGLLGTLDSTAFGEKIRVDAASLYRLINGLCSLRVDADALGTQVADLAGDPGENGTLRDRVGRLSSAVASAQKAILDLQARAVDLAAVPLSEITNTFPQLVRYLSRRSGKEIRFELVGDEHAVDRQVLDALSDPLRQLLVNAIEHGVEAPNERTAVGKPPTATISFLARVVDHKLDVVVADDGRGVDWAAVRRSALRRRLLPAGEEYDVAALKALLFAPQFSTAMPGELVGDGNGLATLAAAVESLHGSVTLDSTPGEGTEVRIVVPTSRALQDAVLVVAGGQTWGLPEIAVLDRLPLNPGNPDDLEWQGSTIPVRSFAEAVGLSEVEPPTRVLVVSSQAGPVGFAVTGDLGSRQVAARELGPLIGGVPHLTGAALLGGGHVAVLVDPARLAARELERAVGPKARVLVVDDSRGARQVVGSALGTAGYLVDLAGTAAEAITLLERSEFDAIVLDYVLPTMDGATLVAKIREMGVDVPIVMLSGLATERDKDRALAAGADAYFDKDDVRKGALAAAIAGLLEQRAAT
jgi:chemotaxis protein histidine kinase CheA